MSGEGTGLLTRGTRTSLRWPFLGQGWADQGMAIFMNFFFFPFVLKGNTKCAHHLSDGECGAH